MWKNISESRLSYERSILFRSSWADSDISADSVLHSYLISIHTWLVFELDQHSYLVSIQTWSAFILGQHSYLSSIHTWIVFKLDQHSYLVSIQTWSAFILGQHSYLISIHTWLVFRGRIPANSHQNFHDDSCLFLLEVWFVNRTKY